jgi:hypothetical protein
MPHVKYLPLLSLVLSISTILTTYVISVANGTYKWCETLPLLPNRFKTHSERWKPIFSVQVAPNDIRDWKLPSGKLVRPNRRFRSFALFSLPHSYQALRMVLKFLTIYFGLMWSEYFLGDSRQQVRIT